MAILVNNVIQKDYQTIISSISSTLLCKLKGKTILITGANGFIGKYLLNFLLYLNKNYFNSKTKRIHIIALISKRNTSSTHLKNDLFNHPECSVIKHDLQKKLLRHIRADFVFHFASVTSPEQISNDPLNTIKTNILGTLNIFDAIKTHTVSKFIYLSSSAIYGNPDKKHIPTPENFVGAVDPWSFRATYAESKRLAETICAVHSKKWNVPIIILRPFHIYGPCMDLAKDNALNYILRCALHNTDITLKNSALSKRSFCYISDAVTIILSAALYGYEGEVFNVGNEKEEISIVDLAKLVLTISDKPLSIHFDKEKINQYQKEIILRNTPSMKKVKTKLNFTPRISLKEGLIKTLTYYECI